MGKISFKDFLLGDRGSKAEELNFLFNELRDKKYPAIVIERAIEARHPMGAVERLNKLYSELKLKYPSSVADAAFQSKEPQKTAEKLNVLYNALAKKERVKKNEK